MSEDYGYRKQGEIGERCLLFRETTTFGDDVSSVKLLFTELIQSVMKDRTSKRQSNPLLESVRTAK